MLALNRLQYIVYIMFLDYHWTGVSRAVAVSQYFQILHLGM